MGTGVINNIEGTLHIKEGDLLAIDLDQLPLTGSDFTGFSYEKCKGPGTSSEDSF